MTTQSTPPTTLPLSAFRIGMRVQIDNPNEPLLHGLSGTIYCMYGAACVVLLNANIEGAFPYQHLRPILRPLSGLSDEEVREVYRRAFSQEPSLLSGINDDGWKVEVYSYGENDTRTDISFDVTGPVAIACHTPNQGYGCPFADVNAVFDYLDSIGVDCRGWIERGLAVAEETTQKQPLDNAAPAL